MSAITRAISAFERTGSIIDANCEVIKKFNAQTGVATVQIYKEELEKSWHEYYLAYETLEATLTGKKDDDLKNYLTDFGAVHNKFITARITIMQCLNLFASNSHDHLNTSNQSNDNYSGHLNFKMPEIHIKPFNGDLDDWPEFKASCNSVFDDKIPEVHRLQYLKDFLTGEPRELVKHITPTDGAYNEAWLILKTRYDNTRAIVNACLKRFFDLPALQTESSSGLKIMLNTTNNTLSTLKGVKIDVTTWNSILVYILTKKLDSESIKHWEVSQNGSKSVASMTDFFDFLNTRINILNNTELMLSDDPRFGHSSYSKYNKAPVAKPQSIMLTLKANFKCFLCSENHIIARCPTLLHADIKDRINKIKERALCLNCLNRHKVEECPYSANCRNCDAAHHSLLHESKGALIATMTEETNVENTHAQDEEHFFYLSTGQNAILGTAVFPVTHNGKTITVRALVDQGGTASLITSRLCQLLNVPLQSTYVPLTGPCDVKVGSIKE